MLEVSRPVNRGSWLLVLNEAPHNLYINRLQSEARRIDNLVVIYDNSVVKWINWE